MRVGFFTDPLETFQVAMDTTIPLMREAKRRSFSVFYWTLADIKRERGALTKVFAKELSFTGVFPRWHTVIRERLLPIHAFQIIFFRKDPPLDLPYLHALALFDAVRDRVLLVNDSVGSRLHNDKLAVFSFPKLMPPSCVSVNPFELFSFYRRHRHIIVKPLEFCGGKGVQEIRPKKRGVLALLREATDRGRSFVLAQRFLSGLSKTGDKRLLLVRGRPVGAVVRRPRKGSHLANIHAGASVHRANITPGDRRICETLRPYLQRLGLHFVGVDVIDGYVTEINAVSPSAVPEINKTTGGQVERVIFDRLLALRKKAT